MSSSHLVTSFVTRCSASEALVLLSAERTDYLSTQPIGGSSCGASTPESVVRRATNPIPDRSSQTPSIGRVLHRRVQATILLGRFGRGRRRLRRRGTRTHIGAGLFLSTL